MSGVMNGICALGAAVAALSWVLSLPVRRFAGVPFVAGVAGWAGLSALSHLVVPGPSRGGTPALVLAGAGAVALLAGAVAVLRGSCQGGRAAPALLDALLAGGSAVLVVVAVVPRGDVLGVGALPGLCSAVLGATVLVLLTRVSAVPPPAGAASTVPVVDPRARRQLLTGSVAGGLLALAGILQALVARAPATAPARPVSQAASLPGPMLLAAVCALAAYVVVAAVPWVPPAGTGLVRLPSPLRTFLPHGLLLCAAVAVALRAAVSGAGAVLVVLGTAVLSCLVGAHVLVLRENVVLRGELDRSLQAASALAENTTEVVVRLDAGGRIVAANAAAEALLSTAPRALLGRRLSDLAAARDVTAVREAVRCVLAGVRSTIDLELCLAPPASGTAQLRLRAVTGGVVANLRDVTDAVELRERLERMSRFDTTTGLPRRAHVLETVGRWLDAGSTVTLLYGDLDGFKDVNDRFGHAAGDSVLVEVAERLARVAGQAPARRGMVGRMGGDEFVLALEGGDGRRVRAVAESVVQAVRAPFIVGDRALVLEISVGVADSTDRGLEGGGAEVAAELAHRADLAMVEAKTRGRGRVLEWTAELEARAQRRVDIAIGLRRALDTGSLDIAYQPMVRLSDGVVVAVEALLRIPSEDHAPGALCDLAEVVSPAELVEVAESTGVITEVGEWVLERATRQIAEWREQGHDLTVAVNISVAQLMAEGFGATVARVLADSGIPPDRLMLEITENQLVGRTGPAMSVLERLRATDVVLAIDDFGTGYSSLAYLRHLPVRVLKIDRALLDGVGDEPRATTLVRAVVGVARALGLLVVAEGIEDAATVRLMRDLGAWAGQGFALSRALCPREATDFLERAVAEPVVPREPAHPGPSHPGALHPGAPSPGALHPGALHPGAPSAGAPSAGAPSAGAPSAGAPSAGTPHTGLPRLGETGSPPPVVPRPAAASPGGPDLSPVPGRGAGLRGRRFRG